MGIVFKARQQNLKRLVALKMILAGSYANPKALVRFEQEAETLTQLKRPSIVQVFDFGKRDGKPYFALEYLEGGSLAGELGPHHSGSHLRGRDGDHVRARGAGSP